VDRKVTSKYNTPHGKRNGFVTATKLRTRKKIFVAATKHFATATERFINRTKHFVAVTKYFRYPYTLTNDFVGITKPFLRTFVRIVLMGREHFNVR